jgi:hypothetical protein
MKLAQAIAQDADGKILVAADCYEKLISDGDAPPEVYLNLAVLYWRSTDPDFSGSFDLGVQFVEKAIFAYGALLDEGSHLFSEVTEFAFWRLYIDFIDLRGKPFKEKAQAYALDSLVPYIYLAGMDGPKSYIPQLTSLRRECLEQPTTKNRYLLEVLDGGTKKQHLTPSESESAAIVPSHVSDAVERLLGNISGSPKK